jgi:hypothetical protein
MQRYALNRSCIKCGNESADTEYHSGVGIMPPCFYNKEHLHRRCTRCGYIWIELCLDATPEQFIESLPNPSVVASSTDPRGYVEST